MGSSQTYSRVWYVDFPLKLSGLAKDFRKKTEAFAKFSGAGSLAKSRSGGANALLGHELRCFAEVLKRIFWPNLGLILQESEG